jgi:hypothetical protein
MQVALKIAAKNCRARSGSARKNFPRADFSRVEKLFAMLLQQTSAEANAIFPKESAIGARLKKRHAARVAKLSAILPCYIFTVPRVFKNHREKSVNRNTLRRSHVSNPAAA